MGDTIGIDCKACSGNPEPLVKWTELESNAELGSNFNADPNDCTNVTVSLGPVTKEFHNRVYECYAGNGVNPESREARLLTVECKLNKDDSHAS